MLNPEKTCLGCEHHRFDTVADEIHCLHPQRPPGTSKVLAWFRGCPQYEPSKKEDQTQ